MAPKKKSKRPSPVHLGDSVYLRVVRGPNAEGLWYWRAQKLIDGKQATLFSSWGSVSLLTRIFEEKQANGTLFQNTEKPKLEKRPETLVDLASAWVSFKKEGGAKRSTIDNYEVVIRRLVKCDGDIKLSAIDTAAMDGLLNRLRSSYSDKSVNLVVTVLRGSWAWAAQRNLVSSFSIPIQIIKKPKYAREKYTPSPEEMDLLQEHLSGSYAPWILMLFLVCRHTGCRIGEAEALKWSAINYRNHTITFTGKTGTRIIPLSKTLEAHLLQWMAQYPSDKHNIFQKTPNTVRKEFSIKLVKACKASGINHRITVHSFRRYYVNLLRRKKVDIKVAAELLGHSPMVMVQLYQEATQDDMRAAVDSLEES